MKKLYNNKGYTLLFAALTAALVLGVAVFILSVSRKQFILASTARDSMFSIYAADSGIECVALRNGNWDGSGEPISSSTLELADGTEDGLYLDCNGAKFPMTNVPSPTHNTVVVDDDIRQASGFIDTGGGTCAEIIITTGLDDSVDSPEPGVDVKKVFDARGYNMCVDSGSGIEPDYNNPRTVERALRLTYIGVW